MRVLMISKALVVGAYHKKLEELANLGVDLHLVVPQVWGSQHLEIVKSGEYEIHPAKIYCNGRPHFHLYAGLSRIIREIRPDIMHIDEEHYSMVTVQAMRLANQYGVKALFFTWQNIYKNYPFPFSAIERYNFGVASAALAGNAEAKEVLRRKGFAKPIKIIPQFGVDTDVYHKREAAGLKKELEIPSGIFLIGYMGRLVEEKGLTVLMDAVARLESDSRLILIGSGPLKHELQRKAAALGIGRNVLFVDQVPSRDVPQYLNCLDCIVLPSRTRPNWKEQFGRVLIESMACEVPVIGSESGEIPVVIGDAGLTFQEGDSVALAKRIESLMNNQKLRSALGKKGRERVLKHYTQKIIAEQTFAVYQDILRH